MSAVVIFNVKSFSGLNWIFVLEQRAPSDDEGSEGDAARAEEIVADEDRDRSERSESDDERYIEQKPEKPMGPPIELQIPLRPPPGMPEQVS